MPRKKQEPTKTPEETKSEEVTSDVAAPTTEEETTPALEVEQVPSEEVEKLMLRRYEVGLRDEIAKEVSVLIDETNKLWGHNAFLPTSTVKSVFADLSEKVTRIIKTTH